MFATIPNPIPARMKGLNRAEICDVNFQEFVRGWTGHAQPKPAPDEAILDGSALDARGFRERSYKAEKFFRVGKAGQWRERLTKAEIERVVDNHKVQMERFGYWPF